ncbi:Telomerase protein component 1 rTLP1 [Fibrella aestuarina BUZ 2]|uniref:Telomerase protein component 1 rTLP1 n=1 Tax=Fibrella aestuarina BUZ 2 TaxID=1166018 RepID=I0KCY0_9BACT|nr:TROVE domain-containing protein [Fibrella aestuarina]CCH01983.1 Telomerase protein component 1 rTLP1 [Fibrella aestuarina BUZ 2]
MRFNTTPTGTAPDTLNHEGASAYSVPAELELYSAVVTTLLADVTYEKADERLTRIVNLANQVSPLFLAKLAVYAREQMYLRTAPIVLLGTLAMRHNGDDLVSRTIARVIQRPDEITELLAYYQAANGRSGTKKLNKLSKQLQKGLAAAFNRFDEYQLAKYNRKADITLRDALFLVHPRAKDAAQQRVFDKLVKGTLQTPYTWETELSALGQQAHDSPEAKQEATREKWHELIDSRKTGYMALLRNLRNMLEAGIDAAHLKTVSVTLANEQAVRKARQLPFRYLAAYRELKKLQSPYLSYLGETLETALQASVNNLRGFEIDTRVVIACDVSGSMRKAISENSTIQNYDIGLLLGMLLHGKCANVLAGVFGDRWATISLMSKGVLTNIELLDRLQNQVGYSTNGYLVLKDLIERRHQADKVMIFTDCQLWDSSGYNQSMATYWVRYKQLFPKAKLYLFDLAGYGTSPVQVMAADVYLIAGWSDKIFDVLGDIEQGGTVLDTIHEISL